MLRLLQHGEPLLVVVEAKRRAALLEWRAGRHRNFEELQEVLSRHTLVKREKLRRIRNRGEARKCRNWRVRFRVCCCTSRPRAHLARRALARPRVAHHRRVAD